MELRHKNRYVVKEEINGEHIEIPTDSDFEPGTVLELVCTEDDTVICTLPESIDDTEEWIFNQAEFLEKVRPE